MSLPVGAEKALFNNTLSAAVRVCLHGNETIQYGKYNAFRLAALVALKSGDTSIAETKIDEASAKVKLLEENTFPSLVACSFLYATKALLFYKNGVFDTSIRNLKESQGVDEKIISEFSFFMISPHIFQNFVNRVRVHTRSDNPHCAIGEIWQLAKWSPPIPFEPGLRKMIEIFRSRSLVEQVNIIGREQVASYFDLSDVSDLTSEARARLASAISMNQPNTTGIS